MKNFVLVLLFFVTGCARFAHPSPKPMFVIKGGDQKMFVNASSTLTGVAATDAQAEVKHPRHFSYSQTPNKIEIEFGGQEPYDYGFDAGSVRVVTSGLVDLGETKIVVTNDLPYWHYGSTRPDPNNPRPYGYVEGTPPIPPPPRILRK